MIGELAVSRQTVRHNEPDHDCTLCPRLRRFALDNRKAFPGWHNGPVETWYPLQGPGAVNLLIVGLAPGLRGANRTGIPFTGDESGTLLYETLARHGFAENGLHSGSTDRPLLQGTAITNAVRCVPPQNKPLGAEINTCRGFLVATISRLPGLKVIVTLGRISHESTIRALGGKAARHPFAHAAETEASGVHVISSYHCSRYNTNTGRLTQEMFDMVFEKAARAIGPGPEPLA
ncbi:uracil-DNA glycosylase [Hoeflea alexandrii]|nr:uracil-DNA glycosylase [Hoeflea alexandrii]